MGLIEIGLNGMLAFYVVAGSTSLGYVFLRLGWPDIRKLDKQYKTGWSIIIGLVFSAIVVIASLAFSLNPFYTFDFGEALVLNLAITFIAATLLLTIKRKFLVRNNMTVSMPSTLLGAKVTAKKVVEQLENDPGFIRAAKFEGNKIDELKKRLGRDEEAGTFSDSARSGVIKISEVSQTQAKPGKFAAQQSNQSSATTATQKPIVSQPESKPAEKFLPVEKPGQAQKIIGDKTKQAGKPVETKQMQQEQQAKKLDKLEELRRLLDERLIKGIQETPQKPTVQKPFENKQVETKQQPESKPFAAPFDMLKKITEGNQKKEEISIGWNAGAVRSDEKKATWPPAQKQEPMMPQKTQALMQIKEEQKKPEEKLKAVTKPPALEGEDEDNVLEKLLEDKQKEIEKLKKIRKVK